MPSNEERMSLRDRAALAVLPVLARSHPVEPKDHWNLLAMSAYACADAFMKERARRMRARGGQK